MKKYIVIAVLVLGVGAVAILASPKTSDNKPAATQQPTANAKLVTIQKDMNAGAILVDVRTPEEFAAKHATGAVNLPYDKITAGTYPTTNKTEKIYLYCHTGRRAGIAENALKAAGYTNVENITSLDNWVKMGGKTAAN